MAGAGCSAQVLAFRLYDVNGNPLPAGTLVNGADANKVAAQTVSPDKVPSTTAIGGTIHSVSIIPDANCAAGSFSVKVTTPKGLATVFPFKSN